MAIKLALLLCDTPVPPVKQKYGTYREVFETLLDESRPSQDVSFTLDGFDVVNEQVYPNLDDGGYKAILLSGSAASAYEDKPWINKLVSWVAECIEKHPEIKIIGICYGHQIVARALGGQCVPNNGIWEVGSTEINLTEAGKQVFSTTEPKLSIQQMHRDHVPSLPPGAILLGSTDVSPVQGFVVPYDTPDSPDDSNIPSDENTTAQTLPLTPSSIHILTVQGHPEFTEDIVSKIIDVRELNGAMSAQVVQEGRRRAGLHHDGKGAIGHAIWRVIGLESTEDNAANESAEGDNSVLS